jgi:hypothetical protein
MRLPVVNAIWIGPELGQVQASCLRSFLRQGHSVVLHCYERPKDTPAGVELADAAKLLPEDRMVRHRKSGSLALFSDLLRYELLGAGLGLYVDCDVFCLRPIEDDDYIFGWETNKIIATGVLKLPRNCPVLAALRAIKDTPNFVPPWRKASKRRRLAWLRGAAPAKPLEELKWGTIGPDALTYYAKQHGIEHLASPIDRFYPVNWDHLPLLYDPALSLEDLTTRRTDAIHLWHSLHEPLFRNAIPRGAPLWEIIETTSADKDATFAD